MGWDSIADSVAMSANEVTPLQYSEQNGIVALMDGSGSTVAALNQRMPGVIKVLATSRPQSDTGCKVDDRSREIGGNNPIPVARVDFWKLERIQGIEPGDYLKVVTDRESALKGTNRAPHRIKSVRKQVCGDFSDAIDETLRSLNVYKDIPQFGLGFEQLLSPDYVSANFVLNNHPGDLTKRTTGQRSMNQFYAGDRFVVGSGWRPSAIAILAGHDYLCTTTHQMNGDMDQGPVFMRGHKLPINHNLIRSSIDVTDAKALEAVAKAAQEALKHIGDYLLAPAVLYDLFKGNFALQRGSGTLAYKFHDTWRLAPNGVTLDDHAANNAPDGIIVSREAHIRHHIDTFYTKIKNKAI